MSGEGAASVSVTLPGGYRLVKTIGEGGHARVWEAEDEAGRRVAVKVLRSRDRMALTRFKREIKVLQALPASPHVVKYYGGGEDATGRPFFAMEKVSGYTLGALIARGTRLEPRVACKLMVQLCEAFSGLHRLGVAHGDINPDNVMITTDGQTAKLLDFGLVRDAQGLLRLFEEEAVLSGADFRDDIDSGMLMGSPSYMAPEQFADALEPEMPPQTDTPSDIFGLGVLTYQLISGVVPFPFVPNARKGAAYHKALLEYADERLNSGAKVAPRLDTNEALWRIVERALRFQPKERWGDARELGKIFKAYLDTGHSPIGVGGDGRATLKPRGIEVSTEAVESPQAEPARGEDNPARASHTRLWLYLAAGVVAAALTIAVLQNL